MLPELPKERKVSAKLRDSAWSWVGGQEQARDRGRDPRVARGEEGLCITEGLEGWGLCSGECLESVFAQATGRLGPGVTHGRGSGWTGPSTSS